MFKNVLVVLLLLQSATTVIGIICGIVHPNLIGGFRIVNGQLLRGAPFHWTTPYTGFQYERSPK